MRARNAKKCQFQVELLEGRIALSNAAAAPAPAAVQTDPTVTVPFKERVTLVSTSPGPDNTFTSTFTGNATGLGKITLIAKGTIDPVTGVIHQTYTRIGANGDEQFGHSVFAPTGNATGETYTFKTYWDGGTGRFTGITGSGTGVVYLINGVETAEVTGTVMIPKGRGA